MYTLSSYYMVDKLIAMDFYRMLVVDTETTGKCDMRTPYNEDTLYRAGWPYITQIAWKSVLLDKQTLNLISVENDYRAYIKPEYPEDKYQEEARSKSGIQYSTCVEQGLPIKQVLEEFVNVLLTADFVVGHNPVFDMKVIKAEFFRHGIDQHLRIVPWIDTMFHGCEYLRSIGAYSKYYIKLTDLHKFMVGKVVDNAHSADGDTNATFAVFMELIRKGNMTPNRIKARIEKNQQDQKQ